MLAPTIPRTTRVDHLLIAEMVAVGSRVLDVGCGDGALLQLLADTKNVDGRGIEVSRERVNACVARGLAVIQGDADRDLADYPDGAFDYAILSLTIQATRQPKTVLEQLLRIGRSAIVSFPNFGHWQVRASLAFTGRMPVTENLPEAWYVSPNAHLCTIKDFADLVGLVDAEVEAAVAFNTSGRRLPIRRSISLQNLFGEKAVFLLRKQQRRSLSFPSPRSWRSHAPHGAGRGPERSSASPRVRGSRL
jgi:methionine biosynthesis protein MetW